jgi:hypothetical protein
MKFPAVFERIGFGAWFLVLRQFLGLGLPASLRRIATPRFGFQKVIGKDTVRLTLPINTPTMWFLEDEFRVCKKQCTLID